MDWYVAVVASQREIAARELLTDLGYEVMVPTEVKWRRKSRYSRQKVERVYPLLTRYVFIGCEGQPPWWHLRNLEFPHDGRKVIQHVLGAGGWPRPLPPDAVTALKGLDFAIPSCNPHKALRPGDMAQFAAGPLHGKVAKVRKIAAKRARVLIEAFNAMREIEVPLEILEAA